jgi:hypothetical protein
MRSAFSWSAVVHGATVTRLAGGPPVDLVAAPPGVVDGPCDRLGSVRAELPELARRAFVAVDEVIKLERIDRAGVEARKALADVLEQSRQLLLVVVADELPGGTAPCLLALAIAHGRSDGTLPAVTLPPDVRETAVATVQRYCERRVPPTSRSEMRLELSVRGNSITIVERRPPWSELVGPEWTWMRIAQLRYEARSGTWALYYADREDRWWPYDFAEPSPGVDELLRALDEDPSGIFWG